MPVAQRLASIRFPFVGDCSHFIGNTCQQVQWGSLVWVNHMGTMLPAVCRACPPVLTLQRVTSWDTASGIVSAVCFNEYVVSVCVVCLIMAERKPSAQPPWRTFAS